MTYEFISFETYAIIPVEGSSEATINMLSGGGVWQGAGVGGAWHPPPPPSETTSLGLASSRSAAAAFFARMDVRSAATGGGDDGGGVDVVALAATRAD